MRIMVHGGAGSRLGEREPRAREGCRLAALAGWDILAAGGKALEAVERAVTVLEDDPQFNAGTGSVPNLEGQVRLDAAVMDSKELRAGAVAHVRGVRNPVRLARQVLEDGRHVLLVGAGAEEFARQNGVVLVDPATLLTQRQAERWREHYGTVGCVALDAEGGLAAATSTGGRFGSLPGRVGDSPLIGSGTYAGSAGAVSCTGIGEAIIRAVLAKHASDLVEGGDTAAGAAHRAMARFEQLTGSEAGLILVDARGNIGFCHNTQNMAIAYSDARGEIHTQV